MFFFGGCVVNELLESFQLNRSNNNQWKLFFFHVSYGTFLFFENHSYDTFKAKKDYRGGGKHITLAT